MTDRPQWLDLQLAVCMSFTTAPMKTAATSCFGPRALPIGPRGGGDREAVAATLGRCAATNSAVVRDLYKQLRLGDIAVETGGKVFESTSALLAQLCAATGEVAEFAKTEAKRIYMQLMELKREATMRAARITWSVVEHDKLRTTRARLLAATCWVLAVEEQMEFARHLPPAFISDLSSRAHASTRGQQHSWKIPPAWAAPATRESR
jgi:hypothetical protein